MVTGSANRCPIASGILEDTSGSSVLASLPERSTFLTWQTDHLLDSATALFIFRISNAMFRNRGYCYCCASTVEFVATSDWWRDDYRCTNCDSIPRERAVMYCIEKFFPQWRDLTIHESSPVLGRGANRRLKNE